MNELNKDEFFQQINNNDNNKKNIKRKQTSSGQNKFLMNIDAPSPKNKIKFTKSISKYSLKRKSNFKNMNKNDGNILKDYLHSHKFDIQRKKTRRITVKYQKNNNNLNLNRYRTFLNKNNNNNKDWLTVVYYQNDNNKYN